MKILKCSLVIFENHFLLTRNKSEPFPLIHICRTDVKIIEDVDVSRDRKYIFEFFQFLFKDSSATETIGTSDEDRMRSVSPKKSPAAVLFNRSHVCLAIWALRRHKKRWEARGRLETRLQFTGNSFRLHVEIHGNNPVKEEIKSHVYANDTIWYLFVQVYIWVLIIKRFPALLILKNRFAAINWESPVMFIKLTLTDEATRRKAANDFIMS